MNDLENKKTGKKRKSLDTTAIIIDVIKAIISMATSIVLMLIPVVIESYINNDTATATDFVVEMQDTGDKIFNKYYILHNNKDLPLVALGLQYLIQITYDGSHIITIWLNKVYSKNSYLYDSEMHVFWLKRMSQPGYEELISELTSQLNLELSKKNFSPDDLQIIPYTFCSITGNNIKDIHLLISENTVIKDISNSNDLLYYEHGIDYKRLQYDDIDINFINEITEKVIFRIDDLY